MILVFEVRRLKHFDVGFFDILMLDKTWNSGEMNELELTGRARTHIVELSEPACSLHYEVVAALLAMRDAAAVEGIDLRPCSSFRDFQAQVVIWNRKWHGERPLYDRQGRLLQRAQLDDWQAIEAILCWSALPGGSRHHWGSEVDVLDAACIPEGYKVQLVPSEYVVTGIFGKLTRWLDENMHRFGFFRPYQNDRGGVSPEPWHLSYAPVALPALESLSLSLLRQVLESSEIAGKGHVLTRLPEIYTRYMLAIDAPPRRA